MKTLLLGCWIGLWLAASVARAAAPRADMPLAVETPYSEALIAYYSGNYRLALKLLDKIETSGVDRLKVLELKALALQYDGQYQEGVELYRYLLQMASEQNVPPLTLVLYDYQTGILMMQKKRYLEARLHLERSLQKGINRAYTAYLLGLASYRLGDDRAASVYLRAARNKGSEITKPAAAYYLGQVLVHQNNRKEAIVLWKEAQTEVERIENAPESSPNLRETMRELGIGLEAALEEQTRSRFTGNVGVVTAYDSNIVLMPTIDATRFGQGTVSQTFRYNLGLHTAPSHSLDIEPVLSGFTNFNTNPDTSIAQYLVQNAGLIFTLNPLATTRYGVRLDGRFLGRYERSSASLDTEGFDGSLGLFLQAQPSPRLDWGLDFFAQYLDFETDPQFNSQLAMSGTNYQLGGHWHLQTSHRGWNPGVDTSLFYLSTDGSEWRNFGTEVVFSDAIRLTESLTWLLRFSLAAVEFPDRIQDGTDFPYRIGWDLTYRWHEHLRFGTQLSYLHNNTDVLAYNYHRFLASISMDYFF